MAFTSRDYDILERAVLRGTRLGLTRRGTVWIVVAERLLLSSGREVLQARHPSTGEALHFFIDELEGVEVVR